MRVSTGSSTTKKKPNRRRSKKVKKTKVKLNKSRPRRKYRKSANDDESQNRTETNIIKRVTKLLGDVSTEDLPESEADGNIFQDIDLLILGTSTEEYINYTHLLRKEYSHLDDAIYKKMRLKVGDPMGSGKHRRKLLNGLKKAKENITVKVPNSSQSRLPLRESGEQPQNSSRKLRKLRKFLRFTGKMKEGMKENCNISSNSISSTCDGLDQEHSSKDNECILIEPTPEIIIIDDDEDDDKNKVRKDQGSKANESLEEGEIIDTDIEISPKKTDELIPPNSTALDKTLQPPTGELTLFYEDITPGDTVSVVPLYETIKSISVVDSTIMEDVIDLDNSTPVKSIKQKSKCEDLDDSVVFVGEQIDLEKFRPNQMPIYIPLSDNNMVGSPTKRRANDSVLDKVIQPFKKFKDHLGSLYSNTSTPRAKKDDLFTVSEQKRIQMYNTNTYNPNKDVKKKTGKRMVIVDGSNVAFGHSLNKEFSVKGLEICLDYFEKMGHEVKAVVPQFRLQKSKSTDSEKLEKLHRDGKIVLTPCKNLPGKSTTCYDDRFILQLATEFDAAVVSNDNYRDLLHENPAFKKVIENRVIGYTWCNDMFILPKDPYGRAGPTLSVILNRV